MQQRSWSRARAVLLATLSAAPFASTALGVDRSWANANGGTFTAAGNWLGGVVPGPTDRAVFPGNPYTISFPVNVATDRLLVTDDRTTFAMNAHTYLLSNSIIDTFTVGSGSGNLASMLLTNGTLSLAGGTLVGADGSNGTLELSGGGILASTGNVLAGDFDSASGTPGRGTVMVHGNGTLSCNNCQIGFGFPGQAFGTVVLDGGVATFTHALVGSGASGTLTVTNHSDLTTGSVEIGGQLPGAQGTVLLNGAGSSIAVTGPLNIGDATGSAGTLNIDTSATMNVTGAVTVGLNGSGRMQMRGGSRFTGGSLIVGDSDHGELDIGGSAVLNCAACTVGDNLFAPGGSVVVDGPGSALNSSSAITVGPGGPGIMSITNGATAKTGISSAFTVGTFGVVTLAGGTISCGSFARIAGGQFNFNSGTLLLNAATFDLANDLINGGSPRLGADHTVKSTGGLTVNAAQLVMDGGALLGLTLTVGSQGSLLLANPASTVSMTSTVTDNGLIRGNGAISASGVTIGTSGEVRAGATDQLTLASSSVTNNGQINLFGGLITASGTLTNAPTGRISGRGVLDTGTITNSGTISLTGGVSDVFGTITNNSGARVIVAGNGMATLYGPLTNVAGSNFQVSAGSTVVFLGNVTGLGAFTGTGVKDFQGGANLGAGLDSSGDTVISGTSVLTASHVREHALIVDGSAVISPNGTDFGASRVNTLTIDGGNVPTGKLDLNDNDLMVDYAAADEPTPAPTMQSQIAFARHGGSWDRSGITSSAAASHPSHATTLGILEGSSFRQIYGPGATFSGQSVDDTSVLVKYTWYGDSDFNGKVNFDDYVRTDNGFNNHLTGWLNGDFDLNGQVNFDDYVLIDLAFNTQSGTLGRALAFLDGSDPSDRGMDNAALRQVQAHVAAFGADYAGHLLAAVPEPAGSALAVVGLSIVALPRMRRWDRSI